MWKGSEGLVCAISATIHRFAGVAQLVEHLICNQRVRGSNPFASSRKRISGSRGVDSGATGFSKRTPFGTFPACSDLRAVLRARFLVSLLCENCGTLFAEVQV